MLRRRVLLLEDDLALRSLLHEALAGEGFDVRQIPDPCDPANLFKTSGRGVLLIHNIMDEVEYNAQGNRVKMVKRPED